MIINLNKDYRIKSDSQQWIAQKRKKREWCNIGYYAKFESCFQAIYEMRIRQIDSSVPDKIIEAIKSLKREAGSIASKFTPTAP